MREGSVSPLDLEEGSVGAPRISDDAWEGMMKTFDQDQEEVTEEEKKDWEEAHQDHGNSAQQVRIVRSGYSPTKSEVAEHRISHLPFRDWCEHCVKGRSKGLPHRIKEGAAKEEQEVPVISVDYMFMGDKQSEGDESGMPILVVKDRKTRIIRARVVPNKGRHWYAIKMLVGIINNLGHKRIIFKSDQEPSIMALKDAVRNEIVGSLRRRHRSTSRPVMVRWRERFRWFRDRSGL